MTLRQTIMSAENLPRTSSHWSLPPSTERHPRKLLHQSSPEELIDSIIKHQHDQLTMDRINQEPNLNTPRMQLATLLSQSTINPATNTAPSTQPLHGEFASLRYVAIDHYIIANLTLRKNDPTITFEDYKYYDLLWRAYWSLNVHRYMRCVCEMDKGTIERFKKVAEDWLMEYVKMNEAFGGAADDRFQGCWCDEGISWYLHNLEIEVRRS